MTRKYEKKLDVRFKEGDRSHLVLPLDVRIIELLPAEGTQVGGLYQLGMSVLDIGKKFEGVVTQAQLSTRLRILKDLGLVAPVKTLGASRGHVWQQTSIGKEYVAEWLSQQ